ncbi:TPA: homoaconitate hydratase family protein [Candidatus Bathyarchaeota archaeon]|nr:homoaconitate hydratase family protein [Candidatus Bathyarchaeota archaeon]
MTIVETILTRRAGKRVSAGDHIVVGVDRIMSHDSSTPLAIDAFSRFDGASIPDEVRDRIVVVFDHVYPSPRVKYSSFHRAIREFCRRYGVRLYEGDGVCHPLLIEEGLVGPGDVVVGGDSHTPICGVVGALGFGMGSTDIAACWRLGRTWIEVPESVLVELVGPMPRGVYPKDVGLSYVGEMTSKGALGKALEFAGPLSRDLSVDERMPIGALSTEVSAVTGVFPADGLRPEGDYADRVSVDARDLEPLLACPHRVDNVRPVTEVEGREVDQVFVGSCANGTVGDLAVVAKILKGRRVSKNTRMIIVPATRRVYEEAYRRGYLEAFLESGAVVCWPSCGPCLGRFEGVLADGEVCISTSNRNFKGRMGSPDAEIYLASPATAAASAIEGRIVDPRGFL